MPDVDMDLLARQVGEIGETVQKFQETNDERLKEIEKKGQADPVLVEKQQKLEARLDELDGIKSQLEKLKALAARPSGTVIGERNYSPEAVKHAEALDNFLRKPGDADVAQALHQSAMAAKAISSSTGSAGYAIPEIIGSRIQETLQLVSPIRSLLNVITVGSSDYKELVDRNGETGGWVGETDTRTGTNTGSLEEATPTFGEVYARPEIYEHILDDAFFDVRGWLINKVTEEMARLEAIAFISGNGTKKPTGFLNGTPVATGDFDSPARAFQVLQYFATGVADNFQNDGVGSPPGDPGDVFMKAQNQMRMRWRGGASWLMNSTTKGVIRRFKDNERNYLLRSGLEVGEGSQLLGQPIAEMDHMPDIGANAFPVALANLSEAYLAVQRTSLRISIDDNITTPGSVKFYVRRRVGGILRQDQAIKLIKCATS